MNTLVVFAVVIVAAMASPVPDLVHVQQDNLGNYKYSVDSIHGSTRVESHNIPTVSFLELPVERKVPLVVEAAPTLTIAKSEHLPILRNVELVHSTPLIKELEIPQVPLVRSSLVETVPVHSSLVSHVTLPHHFI